MISGKKLGKQQLLKSLVFRGLGPHRVHMLRTRFGSPQLDEVELAYDYLRKSGGGPERVMVDVGAHFGTSLGRFAADGWTVHAFEPDDQNRAVLECRHGHRRNLSISKLAASDSSGKEVEFFTSELSTGISGLNAFDPSHQVSQKVALIRLEDYCEEHQINRIDFLKIDTEGHDLMVLKGLSFEKTSPAVIVCEYEDRKTLPRGYDRFEMADFLRDLEYHVVVSEWFPIEAYGKRHRWKRFASSMESTDGESWGNIIAFRGDVPTDLINQYSVRYGPV